MGRVRDYIGFSVCFWGLAYLALWPFAANGGSGEPFGASLLCGGAPLLGPLCHSARPFVLSPAMHALGALSALVALARLAWHALRRARRPDPVCTVAVPPQLMPGGATPGPRRRPLRTMSAPPAGSRRNHFGLRDAPR